MLFAKTEMIKVAYIALAIAVLASAGCKSRVNSDDTDQRNRVERRALEYLQTTIIESAEIDETGLASTLDMLNNIIARDFGPNERFSYSILYPCKGQKDSNDIHADPFAGTTQFEDMSKR